MDNESEIALIEYKLGMFIDDLLEIIKLNKIKERKVNKMDIEQAIKVLNNYINNKETMKETLVQAIKIMLYELEISYNEINKLHKIIDEEFE